MNEERSTLPLFPLQAVLLPGASIKLRVFERRYLDMVRECGRNGSGFGVCLILEGAETGAPAGSCQPLPLPSSSAGEKTWMHVPGAASAPGASRRPATATTSPSSCPSWGMPRDASTTATTSKRRASASSKQ